MQPRIICIGGDGPPAPLPDLVETQAGPPGLPAVPEAIQGEGSPRRRSQLDRQIDVPEWMFPRAFALEVQLVSCPARHVSHVIVLAPDGVLKGSGAWSMGKSSQPRRLRRYQLSSSKPTQLS